VELREIGFLLKLKLMDSTASPLWKLFPEHRYVETRTIAKSWKQKPVGSGVTDGEQGANCPWQAKCKHRSPT